MKNTLLEWSKTHFGKIVLFGGIATCVVIAGTTGSCPTCALVTDAMRLPSLLIPSAHAADIDMVAKTADLEKAPAWVIKDVEGKTVKSSDFAGKVVLLDFWATWCPPCKAEIPGFIELQKRYGEKGPVVIGVSLDEQGAAVVKPFMKQFGVNYPVVMGDAKIVQDFGGIEGLPTTFVIDRTGNIVASHVGYTSKEAFEKEITPLL